MSSHTQTHNLIIQPQFADSDCLVFQIRLHKKNNYKNKISQMITRKTLNSQVYNV